MDQSNRYVNLDFRKNGSSPTAVMSSVHTTSNRKPVTSLWRPPPISRRNPPQAPTSR